MLIAYCEIAHLIRSEMKFAYTPQRISRLQSKHFTAELFHLPEKANFTPPTQKSTLEGAFCVGGEGGIRFRSSASTFLSFATTQVGLTRNPGR
jgi:hypothetical protein